MSFARARNTRPNSPSPRVCSMNSWLRGNSHLGSGCAEREQKSEITMTCDMVTHFISYAFANYWIIRWIDSKKI